ncbi:MAG: hypothetical protein KGD59_04730 [Candidatus Heimdallarchaeota archaeon]|nr:hypothetical protein [Candidatus Heimdallarchaeota archaeon]
MSRDSEAISYGYPFFYVEESLNENKRTEIIVAALIGFLALGVFAAAIFLAITFDVTIFTVIASLSFIVFIICLVFLVGFTRIHNKKKRTFARMLKAIDDSDVGLSAEELQRISEEIQVRIPRPEVIYRKTKKVKTYQAKHLQYSGEIKGKKCPICKLEINKRQDVLGCPNCQTPFHYGHLFIWLQAKNSCPVCGEEYIIKN